MAGDLRCKDLRELVDLYFGEIWRKTNEGINNANANANASNDSESEEESPFPTVLQAPAGTYPSPPPKGDLGNNFLGWGSALGVPWYNNLRQSASITLDDYFKFLGLQGMASGVGSGSNDEGIKKADLVEIAEGPKMMEAATLTLSNPPPPLTQAMKCRHFLKLTLLLMSLNPKMMFTVQTTKLTPIEDEMERRRRDATRELNDLLEADRRSKFPPRNNRAASAPMGGRALGAGVGFPILKKTRGNNNTGSGSNQGSARLAPKGWEDLEKLSLSLPKQPGAKFHKVNTIKTPSSPMKGPNSLKSRGKKGHNSPSFGPSPKSSTGGQESFNNSSKRPQTAPSTNPHYQRSAILQSPLSETDIPLKPGVVFKDQDYQRPSTANQRKGVEWPVDLGHLSKEEYRRRAIAKRSGMEEQGAEDRGNELSTPTRQSHRGGASSPGPGYDLLVISNDQESRPTTAEGGGVGFDDESPLFVNPLLMEGSRPTTALSSGRPSTALSRLATGDVFDRPMSPSPQMLRKQDEQYRQTVERSAKLQRDRDAINKAESQLCEIPQSKRSSGFSSPAGKLPHAKAKSRSAKFEYSEASGSPSSPPEGVMKSIRGNRPKSATGRSNVRGADRLGRALVFKDSATGINQNKGRGGGGVGGSRPRTAGS
jgi:hypothetical protein